MEKNQLQILHEMFIKLGYTKIKKKCKSKILILQLFLDIKTMHLENRKN